MLSIWPWFALGAAVHGTAAQETKATNSPVVSVAACADLWNKLNMTNFADTEALVVAHGNCEVRVAYAFRYEAADNLLCHSAWYKIVGTAPQRCMSLSRSFDCTSNEFDAYVCPPFATQGQRISPNAAIGADGALTLAKRSTEVRTSWNLAWLEEYPVVDGFILPWSNSGALRPGLRLSLTVSASCSPVSQAMRLKTALRCVTAGGSIAYDPCFRSDRAASSLPAVVCNTAPGSRMFIGIKSG